MRETTEAAPKRAVIVINDNNIECDLLRQSFEYTEYKVLAGSIDQLSNSLPEFKNNMGNIQLIAVVSELWLSDGRCGFTVLHFLKKILGHQFLQVLTTVAPDPAISRIAQTNGITVLAKPFTIEELLAAVEGEIVEGVSAV